MITPILTLGRKLDSHGRHLEVTAKLLNEIVSSFFECKKNNYLPPVLEYHVAGDDRQLSASNDALGVIQSLEVSGGKLMGTLGNLQDRFHDLLSGRGGQGFRPYVSVRILPPNHPYNPNPAKWSLGHMALVPLPADPNTGSPIEFSQCAQTLMGEDSEESLLCYNFGIGEKLAPLEDMTKKTKELSEEQQTLPGVADSESQSNTTTETDNVDDAATNKVDDAPSNTAPSKNLEGTAAVTREELDGLFAGLRQELAGITRQTLADLLRTDDADSLAEESAPEAEPVGMEFAQQLFTDAFGLQLDALVASGNIASASKEKHLQALLSLQRAKSLPGFEFAQGGDPVAGYLEALKSSSNGISSGEPPDTPETGDPLESQRARIMNAWKV